jgi:hypothetical protein
MATSIPALLPEHRDDRREAATEATERSISPLMMTNVMASTTMAFSMLFSPQVDLVLVEQVVGGEGRVQQQHDEQDAESSPSHERSRATQPRRDARRAIHGYPPLATWASWRPSLRHVGGGHAPRRPACGHQTLSPLATAAMRRPVRKSRM